MLPTFGNLVSSGCLGILLPFVKKKKGIFFDVANGRGNRHLPIYSILSFVLFWGAHIHFNRTHLYVPEFNDRKRFS